MRQKEHTYKVHNSPNTCLPFPPFFFLGSSVSTEPSRMVRGRLVPAPCALASLLRPGAETARLLAVAAEIVMWLKKLTCISIGSTCVCARRGVVS